MRLRPQGLHDLHLLLGPAAAIGEVLVQALEFEFVPADADTEAQPARHQRVQRGGLLGHQRGLALREDQDAGGEADALGAAGDEAEQHERVMIGGFRGADALAGGHAGRVAAQHVVRRLQVVDAQSFHGLRIVAHDRRTRSDIAARQGRPELHCLVLS